MALTFLRAAIFAGLALRVISISPNGDCGPKNGYNCRGSNFGNSCGPNNKCGRDPSYSKLSAGCQPSYGFCYAPRSVSPDGTCGPNADMFTCQGSAFGNSCGPNNRCGGDAGYSGMGCQPAYGYCSVCTVIAIPSTITSRTTTVTVSTILTTTTTPVTITSGVSTTSTTTSSTSLSTSTQPCYGQVDRSLYDPLQYCYDPVGAYTAHNDPTDQEQAGCRSRCNADNTCNGFVRVRALNYYACLFETGPVPITQDTLCPSVGTGTSHYVFQIEYGNRNPFCVNGINVPPGGQQLTKREAAPVPVMSLNPTQAYCGSVTTIGYTTTTTRTTSVILTLTTTTLITSSPVFVPSTTQTVVLTSVTTSIVVV